ncbi:hypothetical protein [Myxococcus sp. AS-1-15]|uniref:hypothetical protein n=1 Tax=Myxococcus sp. AS-1-15 TaxID=2874600 RepID=UPI001CBE4E6F|nr:hypothetical protein [Myxococcus sp. AS-1-15]MBZ4400399.1 hypothetical protein [Myxococcus sp. AS-1-15]
MTCATKLVLLGCGASGLTLAHLPELRRYVAQFAQIRGAVLMHGAGDPRKADEPGAFGADRLWEVACHLEWPDFAPSRVDRFPAEWKRLGRRAGPVRNETMAAALHGYVRQGWTVRWVAAHTDPGLGSGTKHMTSLCRAAGWKGRVLLLDKYTGALRPEEATP